MNTVKENFYARKESDQNVAKPNLPKIWLFQDVTRNHSNDFIQYYSEDDSWVQKPTGKGERLKIFESKGIK